jgi:AcrR family transcriptional regulator
VPTIASRAAPRPRRTQSERRAGTRLALLEATAACLIEGGYAGTTTTAVCRRAGVSQGALFKHFASKGLLLGAAAEHLYDRLTERFLERFARIEQVTSDPGERVDQAVRLLWDVFQSDEYAASLELELAARTDPALRSVLGSVLTRHAGRVRVQAAALFPAAHGDRYDRTLDLVLEVMVGMAVSRIADPDPDHYRRLLDHVCGLARGALAPPDPLVVTDPGLAPRSQRTS